MATLTSLNLSTPAGIFTKPKEQRRPQPIFNLSNPWKRAAPQAAVYQLGSGRFQMKPVRAAPDKISDKVAESIKQAQEACEGDPASGECVAAWDEVEELSAAASHARDKEKQKDPLEAYCKDNPETDECRTYED